jgi:pheromone shutdown protein TraB
MAGIYPKRLNQSLTLGGKGDMRPTAVTVIGIFGIVLGLLSLCCNLIGLGAAGLLSQFAELAQQSGDQPPELQPMLENPALMRYTTVSAVVGLMLSVWQVIASILLLGMKPIGYTLMLANAGVWVAWTIVSTIVGVTMVGAPPTSFLTALILMVFPIIVLIVLTRPNIKAAFESSGF